METPSSLRKASQGSTTSYKMKQEGNKTDRTALIDITNDSPIVGLATGSASFVKSPIKINLTPGSGEAILRSQVKTLLQKIEEKEVGPKIPSLPHHLPPSRSGIPGFARSPMQMLAPTPMNTPQIPQIPEDLEQGFLHPPPQIMSPVVQHDEPLGLCVLNRALLFDSPDKNEVSSGSTGSTITSVAYQESVSSNGCFTISSDRSSSIWSIQGNASNASTNKGEEIESESDVEELCKGFRDMAVAGGKFEGKHTRFVYNSDGEMEREECNENRAAVSPGVVVLKGLPVPEGKHLRFQEEEGED